MARAVDPTSDRAVYRQIADRLRQLIVSGISRRGEAAEPVRRRCRLQVSQGTVRQALSSFSGGRGWLSRSTAEASSSGTRPKTRRLAHYRFSRKHRERGKAAFLVEAEAEHAVPSVDVTMSARKGTRRDRAAACVEVRCQGAGKASPILERRSADGDRHLLHPLVLGVRDRNDRGDPGPGLGILTRGSKRPAIDWQSSPRR